ncbi:MAG: HD domain-containing protein [Anaeroplasmataceae bacterium]|nr:HD domain-containing protein [Anaeroplasmataceae bacterium]
MEIIGKVAAINTSDGLSNLSIVDQEGTLWNIKAPLDKIFYIGHVYIFTVKKNIGERVSYLVEGVQSVEELPIKESDQLLRRFFPKSPYTLEESMDMVYSVIEGIGNVVIQGITKSLLDTYQKQFFLYPAASRMHHTYVGGLAYHTIGMIKLAKAFLENYPYLNADYLYSGIILHDLGKTKELTGIEATEYTLDGQLLGHLVIGALEIGKTAEILGYGTTKEVQMLQHMLISHHGQPQFGAAKRPMTPEAVALWYIDTIDSKFRVLGEELDKTQSNHFTESIGVLDKVKIYKG